MRSLRLPVPSPALPERLDRFVAANVPELSRKAVKRLIDAGQVRVGGRPARKAALTLRPGQLVELDYRPSQLTPPPLERRHLVGRGAGWIAVDKPAGVRSHRSDEGLAGVPELLAEVLDLDPESLKPAHRLDKGTSGALVVARNDLALRRLQAAFSIHDVQREYLAVVYGEPRFLEGRIESSLGRHPRDRLRFTSVERGGRRAVTHWRRLSSAGGLCLLSCRLETGRTHQIRVHLLEQGHPVVGDPLYARGRRLPVAFAGWAERLEHQLLHARLLAFQHPIGGQQLAFDVPPPELFREFCDAVGLQVPES